MASQLMILLGIAYLFLLSLLLHRKLGNPVVFFLLAPNLLNFVVKPIYLGLSDHVYPALYSEFYDEEFVISGQAYELSFLSILVFMVYVSNIFLKTPTENINHAEEERSPFLISFFITASLAALLIFIFGTELLPQNRSGSFTTNAPWLRFVFPFMLFSQVIVFAEMYRSWRYKNMGFIFACVFVLFLGFFILNQRGVLVLCLLTLLGHLYSQGLMTKLRLILIFLPIALLSTFAKMINTGSWHAVDANVIFEGPDSAVLQVWSIVMHYVKFNGHDYGQSIGLGLLGILPHRYRYEIGMTNTTDILNLFYSPSEYLGLGFGFNGSLAQGLYIGFGSAAALAYIPFAAYFLYLIRKSEGHFRVGNYLRSFVFAFVATSFIAAGFQTLHWFIPILIIMLVSRVKLVAKQHYRP